MERRKTSFERRELEIVLAARPARGLESIRGPPTYEHKKSYYSEHKNTRGPSRSRFCFYRPVLKLPLTFSCAFCTGSFFPPYCYLELENLSYFVIRVCGGMEDFSTL